MDKKVAIVTGGGSGIGKAISERLIQDGAHVVIADINQNNIDATLKEFNAEGVKATGRRVDVSKPATHPSSKLTMPLGIRC
jgi:NAD(P)-dependent dehydrogenase (short-subunit alcohol dehydrogenase family)